ncbi:3382_t:CDS:2 [Scutellospora calospora]|uniref:3382_t:CDS:1 n=1 Tax=Scutellospora calospora TaxID=85575 RepID=A0ACA9LMV1_9GLOM|nr:3382_t:CDS:2 [Scutellospora calospora]
MKLFLRNLFPPAKVELDEEIPNAENIFKEVEQKRKLINLGIEALKERQITFIFDIGFSINIIKLKLQNSQEPVNRTRPDFTMQNYQIMKSSL